jgi:pyruvate,water dikinase
MGEKIWVVDNDPSQRYPIYTRGNVGEVFPEAVAPLSWTLGAIPGAEQGWRDALVRFGAFDDDEFSPHDIEMLGCFGGYAYLNVSASRVFAVRTPGLTPEIMDQSIFGTSDAPPYQPRPTDESPSHTARINETIGWILTTDGLPDLLDDRNSVDELVASRPDLSTLGNQELVARARDYMGLFRHLFAQHLFITYCSTVPVGMLQGICDAIGQPDLPMKLVAGIGDVDSAAPSWSLWALGREVATSPALTDEFDRGIDGLLGRVRALPSGDAGSFVARFDDFVARYGSRGPNEWEMRAPTWGTHPELALRAIDRMRFAPDSHDPETHRAERQKEREETTQAVADALAGEGEVQGQFLAAVRAAGIFLAGRERTKTTIIKQVHEARLMFHELGTRMVAAGYFDDPLDFGMLTDDEYDDFLSDPAKFSDTIRERVALHTRLQRLEPPFIVNGGVPPLEVWRSRGTAPVQVARGGDVLGGIPGCPGTYTGRARVIRTPDDPTALEPGDVLIAPITDPAWTPLFVPAGAVVVDVGAQISHAVIVSRELGIPCVVSVADATRRIPDGATVTVDGAAGTVTVH